MGITAFGLLLRMEQVVSASGNKQVISALALVRSNCWDADAWNVLLAHAQSSSLKDARSIYDEFLQVFPCAGRVWNLYIQQELASKNYENVEALLKQSLLSCMDIDLWNTYLSYVKLAKASQEDGSQEISMFRCTIG